MPRPEILTRVLLVLIALPVVWFFAPIQMHGHTGYVIVRGASMERTDGKGLHQGDLVLLHESSSYAVGDVVAYHNAKLSQVVLHRIVRITPDGHYIFRGDNNDFDDGAPYPTASDLIGSKSLQLPLVGSAMLWLRDPLHALMLAAVALFLTFFAGQAPAPAGPGETTEPPSRRRRRSAATQLQLLPAIGLALLGGLWLIALATPTSKIALDPELYRQQGSFSWTGNAVKGATYPGGKVKTGDAVFTRVVPKIDVGFDYLLTSQEPARLAGTAQLHLDLSSDAGWHTIQPLGPEQKLTSGGARLRAELDLASLTRLAEAVDMETGVASRSYEVAIVPQVQVAGTVGTSPVDASFTPRLTFAFDTKRLVAIPSTAQAPNGLVRRAPGTGTVTEPHLFRLGPLATDVGAARTLTGWATVLAALVLVGAVLYARRRTDLDEPALIGWRYGDWLVPISHFPATDAFTDVAAFDALVHLADRYNRGIMHLERADEHTYLVAENGVVYRYRAVAAPPRVAPVPGRAVPLP